MDEQDEERKMVFTVTEDEEYLFLMVNDDICKQIRLVGLEVLGITKEEKIGRWYLEEVKPYGGILK